MKVLSNSIVILIILCSSCAGKNDSSKYNYYHDEKNEIILQNTAVFSKMPEKGSAKQVVEKYIKLAREGKFLEIANLVEKNQVSELNKQKNQESVAESPDNTIFNKENHIFLTESLPKLIFDKRMIVKQISLYNYDSEDEIRKKFGVSLKPEDGANSYEMDFYLSQDDKAQWKIFNVMFFELNEDAIDSEEKEPLIIIPPTNTKKTRR